MLDELLEEKIWEMEKWREWLLFCGLFFEVKESLLEFFDKEDDFLWGDFESLWSLGEDGLKKKWSWSEWNKWRLMVEKLSWIKSEDDVLDGSWGSLSNDKVRYNILKSLFVRYFYFYNLLI